MGVGATCTSDVPRAAVPPRIQPGSRDSFCVIRQVHIGRGGRARAPTCSITGVSALGRGIRGPAPQRCRQASQKCTQALAGMGKFSRLPEHKWASAVTTRASPKATVLSWRSESTNGGRGKPPIRFRAKETRLEPDSAGDSPLGAERFWSDSWPRPVRMPTAHRKNAQTGMTMPARRAGGRPAAIMQNTEAKTSAQDRTLRDMLLVALTVASGVVDAISFLGPGKDLLRVHDREHCVLGFRYRRD